MSRAPQEGRKDFWDKLHVVLAPLGGLLTAVAVAFVGIMGSRVIDRRQSIETNARLYSELMSRREEAESNLRKDMLVSIIEHFLRPEGEDVEDKILNLELLAYNFHDSLNLKPLFVDVARRVESAPDGERDENIQRVRQVAREITAKQLFALEGHGRSFRRTVDLEALASEGTVALDGETIRIEDEAADVQLRVIAADVDRQSVRVRLEVKAASPEEPDTRATFDVGWYDFPMIDNTRLANGLRCAVTLSAFSPETADLTTTCFPGEYASLKDRPYYDEVIQKLRDAARDDLADDGTWGP
jgi:hypothetical protein